MRLCCVFFFRWQGAVSGEGKKNIYNVHIARTAIYRGVISDYGRYAHRLCPRRGLKNDRTRHGIRHGLKINRNAKSNFNAAVGHVSRLLLRDI